MSTVTVDGCEVAYEVAGAGLPIVLVHGLGGSTVLWEDVRRELGNGFRVVTYDLRGSGASRERGQAELTLERWSSDLRGLVRHLGVERPVVVGHSLGASIALKYALRWPDDVRGLVLIGADAKLSRLAPRMEKTVEALARLGMPAWVDEVWAKNPPFSEESLARAPELFERYRAMVLSNSAESYTRACLAIAGCEDLSDSLGSVMLPTLVVVGGKDDRTLPEDGRRIAERLPDARLLEIAGSGHSVPLEASSEVAAAITRFTRELDGSGA